MSQAASIFLDALRKQSFSVILTLAGLVALGWWNLEQKSDCESAIAKLDIEMDSCAAHRQALSVEVARLRERINVLASAPVRKR